MINTYLIGKHLLDAKLEAPMIAGCGMCGRKDIPGYALREALGASFMDWDYIDLSMPGICIYCAACLGKNMPPTQWLRSTSFIATEEALLKLKREDIWSRIHDPPNPPFVFCVTYSHKKHISFRSSVNYHRDRYTIQTEEGAVYIDLLQVSELCGVLQKWYTICKDIKTAPTWFSKDDILHGCQNFKKIEAYGVDQYFVEDQIIKVYRGTSLLRLLVYALNKKPMKHTDGSSLQQGDLQFNLFEQKKEV